MAPGVSNDYSEEDGHIEESHDDDKSSACKTPYKYSKNVSPLRTISDEEDSGGSICYNEESNTRSVNDEETEYTGNKIDKDIDRQTDDPQETENDLLLQPKTGENICDKKDDEEEQSKEIIEETSTAPDGGWGWFIILGAVFLRIIIGGMGRSHGLFYIKFIDRYDGSATATAFVTALTGIFRLGGGPFVSILCSRFPCRYLTFIGALLLAAGLLLTGFSPSLQFLYFSYGLICGLGRAFALTPVPILLGYYFDKRRSLAFGLASAGFSMGGFGITPVVEVLFQTFGFQGTFILLSGFALNVVVCSALFRPIELHRKITHIRSQKRDNVDKTEHLVVQSIEDIQSGNVLSSSTIAIEKSVTSSSKSPKHSDSEETNKMLPENDALLLVNRDKSIEEKCDSNNTHKRYKDKDTKQKHLGNGKTEDKKNKKPLIAWSILKDVRFICFCFSNFLISLPSGGLFLPSLAIARGASAMEAASLLSINAGSDTVSRVISGFVLDSKIFRHIRPQIYSTVILLQGTAYLLYPLMHSFHSFVILCIIDGAFAGLKAAQNSVVVMDILGVDKLASSMALTMSIQAVAVLIGPTISGRLKDLSGVYDGAFFFGGAAVILAGLVMTGGNIRKSIIDKREKKARERKETLESEGVV